jgi:transposase
MRRSRPALPESPALRSAGIEIDRSTLAIWADYAAAELKPAWRLMRADLLKSAKPFVDKAKAPVFDPGRGRIEGGYL